MSYTLIENALSLADVIQANSIISRTLYKDEHVKVIEFGFDAGQELSEHTSSRAAIIQIAQGEATVTLGDEAYELVAGAWVHMQPHLKHSVRAKTPLVILLTLLE